MTVVDEILSITAKHEQWRQKCLNLIPSENVMSSAVRSLLSSEFGQRYTSPDRFYMGTRFLDEAEQKGEELAKRLFGSETADLRPLSGHVADLIFLSSFTQPRDSILCVSADDGGYPGIWTNGAPKLLKLNAVGFPYSNETSNIIIDKTLDLMLKIRPKAVIFGQSLFLFPHPVKELAKAAQEIEAHVGYDGSHVLGLIAGKCFQDPLRDGASVLFGSTHKSFFGPQGGIMLADRNHGQVIKSNIYPALVDNAHWNRIAALTLALAEMLEFGRTYARQVIENAKELAKVLADKGFPVAGSSLGYTKSHQVFLDFGSFGKGRNVAVTLEKANIIVDCGVRVGTCELTRRGMKQEEMLQVAEFMERTFIRRERPQKVKRDIEEFMEDFQEVKYCFELD